MGSRAGGIWKLSMKKLGTPIGAGVGSANEYVGFCAVGTSSEVRNGACPFFTAAADCGAAPLTTTLPCTCPESACLPAEVFEPALPVVVVVVDDAELLCELGVELVAGAVVGAPEVGAALVGAGGARAA